MENLKRESSDSNELIGRSVKCINNDFSNIPWTLQISFTFPTIKSYTVRKVVGDSFLLEEIINPKVQWPLTLGGGNGELSFERWRFRLREEVWIESVDMEIKWIHDEIRYDLPLFNALVKDKYSINNLPENEEVAGGGKGVIVLLSELKANVKEYWRLLHWRDQQYLSAYMKALRGETEMTDELQKWWMNRY